MYALQLALIAHYTSRNLISEIGKMQNGPGPSKNSSFVLIKHYLVIAGLRGVQTTLQTPTADDSVWEGVLCRGVLAGSL